MADALRGGRMSDLTPGRLQGALATLRGAGKANQATNHHRAAIRAFARWAVATGRHRDDPTSGLAALNVAADRRHRRRAMTPEECARLIAAAESGPPVRGLAGSDRAMLYRLALGTGLRAAELGSLTPASFDLAGDPPTVACGAGATKNGRDDSQSIAAAPAARLAPWLATRAPDRPVFGPMPQHTAAMIRRDLAAVGVPYQTPEGITDFHSLRGTYITRLVATGASVKTCQILARYSTPSLTIGVYAKASPPHSRRPGRADPSEKSLPTICPPEGADRGGTGRNLAI